MKLILFLLASGSALLAQTYDAVILDGRIVDGSGNAWFHGDLAIRGDRIARITPAGMLREAQARERIDARGLVIAPGFIDIQGQSGRALLNGDGRLVSKVTQGVTTEILGEGETPAPANGRTGDSRFAGPRGFDKWLRAIESNGASVNAGSFVGAATIRAYVKGMAMGAATPAEIAEMQKLMREAMEDGAFGLASALIYPPGIFAGTNELAEIAKAMAPYGGVYITHMRSEADQFLEAVEEAMEIGRRGGVPVEIYHLKAGGERNWPKIAQAIGMINAARRAGQDVGADMYPYVAGGTGLSVCFPPWSAADDKLFDNLKDNIARARMKDEMGRPGKDWENLCELAGPANVLITSFRNTDNRAWAGKRLSQIATAQSKDWRDTAMDLVLADQSRVNTIFFLMSEDNLKRQLREPWIKFGTDAGGVDPETATSLTHPRAYGTFTRILGKYVREENVIPLEDAVRKMTSAVARRLSIPDRGLLQEGMLADIVIFDADTVADRATFEKPHQISTGVRHVYVNGICVLRDGKHTGAKPGRIVRGPGFSPVIR